MVNFNNDVTIGRPAVDVERILLLQRRDAVIDAIEAYAIAETRGSQVSTQHVQGRLTSLYYQMYGMLKRRYASKEKKKEFADLKERLKSDDYETLVKAFEFLSEVLDGLRLTRIDTKVDYDATDIEEDNRHESL